MSSSENIVSKLLIVINKYLLEYSKSSSEIFFGWVKFLSVHSSIL